MAGVRRGVKTGREGAWAEAFKAMGDPTRLSILLRLVEGEENVTGLAKNLELDAPTVSFHLTKLRYSGLVVNERRGQQVFYKLNPSRLKGGREGRVLEVEGCVLMFRKRN
jgi:DNA-binding transcriptional ArsR family regulator